MKLDSQEKYRIFVVFTGYGDTVMFENKIHDHFSYSQIPRFIENYYEYSEFLKEYNNSLIDEPDALNHTNDFWKNMLSLQNKDNDKDKIIMKKIPTIEVQMNINSPAMYRFWKKYDYKMELKSFNYSYEIEIYE